METIHAHINYTCKKVSKDLKQYDYNIVIAINNSFDVIHGNREFNNYSEFIDHCKNHILTFYRLGEKDEKGYYHHFMISDNCWSSIDEIINLQF
jgi:hypothetical protein